MCPQASEPNPKEHFHCQCSGKQTKKKKKKRYYKNANYVIQGCGREDAHAAVAVTF